MGAASMTARQAVIFVHGIGNQGSGYSHPCRERLQRRIRTYVEADTRDRCSYSPDGIKFAEVWWAPVVAGFESELWQRVRETPANKRIATNRLRSFMVQFIGDALAYQRTPRSEANYCTIHSCIARAVRSVHEEIGSDAELTFIAHSLGTVIVSNYLRLPRRNHRATNLFTLGSPIALWTLLHGHPCRAGNPPLMKRLHGAWINILDNNDLIAYPLRGINAAYRSAVDKDYVTQIGLPFFGNVFSHVRYWTDRNVIKPIAFKLAQDYRRLHGHTHHDVPAFLKFIDRLWNI